MEKFFEDIRKIIPVKGKLRMLIDRTNDDLIVTIEIKAADGDWTSPTMGRGHFSVLDQNLFKDLEKGVEQIKPYMVDTKKMVDSVKPKETAKTPEKKAEKATPPAPKVEEAKLFDTTTIGEAMQPASSGLAEASGIVEEVEAEIIVSDPETGEIIPESVTAEDDDFADPPKPEPAPVAKPDYESTMTAIKAVNAAGKFQEAVDQLNAFLVHYPGDERILAAIVKVSAKIPVQPAIEDF